MLLEIDEQSEQPIYQQLIDQIIVALPKVNWFPVKVCLLSDNWRTKSGSI